MTNRRVLLALAGLLAVLGSDPARAAGFGVYLDYSYADGEIDFENDVVNDGGTLFVLGGDLEYETDRLGVGLVFDTNVARYSWFNYRAQLGYQHGWQGVDDFPGTVETDGFTFDQTFGFSPIRSVYGKLWAGPSVRFSLDVFDEDDVADVDSVIDVSGGLGPAVGVNWHMGPRVSGSLRVSYQYMFLGEIVDFGSKERSYRGGEHLVTVGVSLLLRTAADQPGSRR